MTELANNKDQKGHESSIGEILDTLKSTKIVLGKPN